jgi:hypothetical protein
MEAVRVPDDRQHHFVVIDPSFFLCSRLIIRWKPLLFPVNLPMKPRPIKSDNLLPPLVSDWLEKL